MRFAITSTVFSPNICFVLIFLYFRWVARPYGTATTWLKLIFRCFHPLLPAPTPPCRETVLKGAVSFRLQCRSRVLVAYFCCTLHTVFHGGERASSEMALLSLCAPHHPIFDRKPPFFLYNDVQYFTALILCSFFIYYKPCCGLFEVVEQLLGSFLR